MGIKMGTPKTTGGQDANLTIQNASFSSKSFDVSSEDNSPQDVTFNNNGTRMFVMGSGSDTIYQYNLSAAYDLTSASFSNISFSVSSEEDQPNSVTFDTIGSRMFVVGIANDKIRQYNLGTNFDIATASFTGNSFDVSSEEDRPESIAFNADGTRMFIVGRNNDKVHQYNLGTAFDITTASFNANFDVSSEDADPRGIEFNSIGTRMFIVGTFNNKIYQYNLGTGFDITTASFSGKAFNPSSEDNGIFGVTFNDDGTRMFIAGQNTKTIYQYDL